MSKKLVTIDSYEKAVEELCVINFINWDHTKPMETLKKIIQVETSMALDPKISKEAVDLIQRHGGSL